MATLEDQRASADASERVTLDISGMTCAACASRIERKLNKLDGVEASVNYSTEKATVRFDPLLIASSGLIETVESIGYGARLPDHEVVTDSTAERLTSLRRRVVVSALLGAPVLLMSMVRPLQFDGWQWVSLALTAPIATWGAWPFHRAAYMNVRHGSTTMDTLVSVGVIAAFGWSLWALVIGDAGRIGMTMDMSLLPTRSAQTGHGAHGATAGHDEIYLEVAATLVALLLAGRYFEARAKGRAGAALKALIQLGAKHARVVRDGIEVDVPIDDVVVGDVFVVRPGEKLATDGIVVDGSSSVDLSLVTGESAPVDVGSGDAVIGGTVNGGGALRVRATRVGAETTLAQMARLVDEAQSGKAPVQRLADQVSAIFVPTVILISLVTLAVWWIFGDNITDAFTAAVAVLIIACPCALGLATPTALMVGTGKGAQMGILIRGPEILEAARGVDVVVLDKTGTVTDGAMSVVDVSVDPDSGADVERVLRLAASVEARSEHAIAAAIVRAAGPDAVDPVDGFHSEAGGGVVGRVGAEVVTVGRPSWVTARGAHIGAALAAHVEERMSRGETVVAVAVNDATGETPPQVIGAVAVADAPKPHSAEAIAALQSRGLRTVLLTGDNAPSARVAAAAVGIGADDVIADVLPADKVDVVRRLQQDGHVVAMIGDGVNDAAALAQADLGMAMGSGTDVAIEASDLTIVRSDLRAAVDAIALSQRTLRTIKGNLFWAFAYNVAALPLAALGYLNPVIAGAAMALSSVFVVSNSLRLRRFRTSFADTV